MESKHFINLTHGQSFSCHGRSLNLRPWTGLSNVLRPQITPIQGPSNQTAQSGLFGAGMGGRFAPEWVADLNRNARPIWNRNGWPISPGIRNIFFKWENFQNFWPLTSKKYAFMCVGLCLSPWCIHATFWLMPKNATIRDLWKFFWTFNSLSFQSYN